MSKVTSTVPTPSEAIAFFDAIAHRYDRDYVLDAAATRARAARILGALRAGERVLDLGVGTGRELPLLIDAGLEVTGLDASERMLEHCRKRARPIPLVVANFYEPLPFEDASFDAVLALHGTLAHPPTEAALADLLREVARVLSPGGWFFAEIPTPAWVSALEAHPLDDGNRLAERAGPNRTRHRDRASGAVVEAVVFDDATWRAMLETAALDGPAAGVEAISPFEQLVIGRAPSAPGR